VGTNRPFLLVPALAVAVALAKLSHPQQKAAAKKAKKAEKAKKAKKSRTTTD